jgi:DHA1 family tetracycline resistance protein-like MFS transporter
MTAAHRKGYDVTFFPRTIFHLSALPRIPLPAAVSIALFFLGGLADGVLMPFFALWASREAQVPTEYIGLLLGCYAGGELLATPLVGGIADRFGRRPVLLVSTLGIGLGFLLLYCTRGVPAAACSLIVIGIFESVFHPTAATVIADVTPAGQLRSRYAMMRMASNGGRLIGPACGAMLVYWSLGLVFLGSALAMLAAAAIVALLMPETLQTEAGTEEDDDDDLAALGAAFRDRRLAALLIPVALIGIALSWVESLLPLYAVNAGTLTPASVGWLFTYAALIGVVFQIPVLRGVARLTGATVILAGTLAAALAFAALALSAQLPFLIVAMTSVAFSEMLSGPLTQTLATQLAPVRARATYLAAFSAAGDLKDAAGPALGAGLYALSSGLPWLIGLPLVLSAGLSLAAVAGRHDAPVNDRL